MHIILTGATGSVGAPVLRHCLASPSVTRLSILSRRQFALPTGEEYDAKKVEIIVQEDFANYPEELLEKLRGARGCIWAQGISQNEVTKDQYVRITYDYPMAAAKAFSSLSPNGVFNFVYVSGEGADPTEKSRILFARIKGRTETHLLALPSTYAYLRVYNVRPAFVDPPNPERPRPLLINTTAATLGPLMRTFMPGHVSPVASLARVLLDLAEGDGEPLQGSGVEAGGWTLRNTAIRRLAGLDK